MSRTRLGKNTLWLFTARLGAHGLMTLFTIVIARRLGEAGLGEYAFVASAIFLGNVLTTFGVDMLLIREIAAGANTDQLPAALIIQLALSLLFASLIAIGAPTLPTLSRDSILALQIYSLALFPLAFTTVFTSILRGRQLMGWYALLNLASTFLQFTAAWFWVRPGGSVAMVALLLLAVQSASAVLAGAICAVCVPGYRHVRRFRLPAMPLLSAMARASAPIALLGLLGVLYQKLGVYMVAGLAGAAATGWFSAALRIVEASKIGHFVLFTALYPALAQAHSAPHESAGSKTVFAFSWNLLLALAGAEAAAMYLFAPWLVRILFGPAFEPSAPALRILAWVMIPYTVGTYLSLACLAAGRERLVMRALAAGLVTQAALGVWWISPMGLAGVCWALLAAETVQAGTLWFLRRRDLAATRWGHAVALESIAGEANELSKLS